MVYTSQNLVRVLRIRKFVLVKATAIFQGSISNRDINFIKDCTEIIIAISGSPEFDPPQSDPVWQKIL